MFRIGQGYDVHRFTEQPPTNGAIKIGGIDVASNRDILAHSDGDVVLHAVCDALLGALALGDIGLFFPDTDPAFKNKDSAWFVQQVIAKVHEANYLISNIDITIIAETPKIKPYREEMISRLSTLLTVDNDQVSVKATTTEKLGFTGRQEGIAAQVIVLLHKQDLDGLKK